MTLNGNFWTHLAGTLFALCALWIAWPAAALGWQWSMGVVLFLTGMFLMFTSSTVYHAAPPGRTKDILRKLDHINIYVMIACSYSPILLGVVGGALGWGVFVLMWLVTLGGAISKIVAIGRYPRLSLAVYLIMGWSVVFIARPVWQRQYPARSAGRNCPLGSRYGHHLPVPLGWKKRVPNNIFPV